MAVAGTFAGFGRVVGTGFGAVATTARARCAERSFGSTASTTGPMPAPVSEGGSVMPLTSPGGTDGAGAATFAGGATGAEILGDGTRDDPDPEDHGEQRRSEQTPHRAVGEGHARTIRSGASS